MKSLPAGSIGAVLALALGAATVSAAVPPAPRLLLLDGAIVGRDVVAVGERGVILRSATRPLAWQPVTSGSTATLTGISFAPDGRHGWAVGHEAVIIATADGGRTWRQQAPGENAQDSFLDVVAVDAQHAIAIGAYGLLAGTNDGGKTWSRRKVIDEDYHLNRITAGAGGVLYVAGEHGTLLRSADTGANWTPIPAPYAGSFYGLLPLEPGQLLAHGLRGHVYLSANDGAAWEPVPTPRPVLLATALRLRDHHTVVLAGQARGVLVSRDGGRSFDALPEMTTAIAELLELPDGAVLALGEAGATILPVNPR